MHTCPLSHRKPLVLFKSFHLTIADKGFPWFVDGAGPRVGNRRRWRQGAVMGSPGCHRCPCERSSTSQIAPESPQNAERRAKRTAQLQGPTCPSLTLLPDLECLMTCSWPLPSTWCRLGHTEQALTDEHVDLHAFPRDVVMGPSPLSFPSCPSGGSDVKHGCDPITHCVPCLLASNQLLALACVH